MAKVKEGDKRVGNQFWKLRSKHGRDKIFTTPKILWDAACEYFQYLDDNPLQQEELVKYKDYYEYASINKMRPYTLTGLCLYLDVNVQYFTDFEKGLSKDDNELSKDFSLVCTRIRETIYAQKFEGAAAGFLNPSIIARDLGLQDKTDITTNGKELPSTPIAPSVINVLIEGSPKYIKD